MGRVVVLFGGLEVDECLSKNEIISRPPIKLCLF
jgi:hypothetical protein